MVRTETWTSRTVATSSPYPGPSSTIHRRQRPTASATWWAAATAATSDTGKLNVTWHHVWWADNVDERQPRVRFGKVHLFNNLYTAAGDSAAIEVGVSCNIRSENNDLRGVSNPVDSSHSNSASVYQSIGNLGNSTQIGGAAFTPPYTYSLDSASSVDATVRAGAGPK